MTPIPKSLHLAEHSNLLCVHLSLLYPQFPSTPPSVHVNCDNYILVALVIPLLILCRLRHGMIVQTQDAVLLRHTYCAVFNVLLSTGWPKT